MSRSSERVAILGSGLIGRAWAIAFARAGWSCALWDPAPDAAGAALATIDGLLADLAAGDLLGGQSPGDVLGRMTVVPTMAEAVRKDRRPAAPENAFVTGEHAVAKQIEQALDRYRELRERMQELTFKAIYNSPLVEALAGLRAPHADALKQRARDQRAEQLFEAKAEAIKTREEQGGFAEAVLRIMLAVAQAEHMFDVRGFRLLAQGAQGARPVHAGHHHVEQDQVGPDAGHVFEAVETVFGFVHLHAAEPGEAQLGDPADVVFVVDDQNSHGSFLTA